MMTPKKGVVMQVSAGLMTIRLETGARVSVEAQKGLRRGDVCYICYDHTRMQTADVWTESEYFADDDTFVEEVDHEEIEEVCRLAEESDPCFGCFS